MTSCLYLKYSIACTVAGAEVKPVSPASGCRNRRGGFRRYVCAGGRNSPGAFTRLL